MNRVIILAVLLTGCASVEPYAEVGINYAFPFSADYWVNSEQSWQCEQPQFETSAGIEWRNGVSLGVYHESMLLCGSWNRKPEIYENGIEIKKRWGGWRYTAPRDH